ncbi:PREDICTED: uncharacterized protein LOC109208983 isoform X4 [Nicotiana attenuata]|uniref:uncharacterized protein LOC109208983 isoform X4 n=1 Tax=Nicotiana attenuata TaxID=49451 RepID=UPI000905C4B3|nr:PREDICTED: uncharacterized protein LOC109208983 isoform X4 [Nicotiana attenuata]
MNIVFWVFVPPLSYDAWNIPSRGSKSKWSGHSVPYLLCCVASCEDVVHGFFFWHPATTTTRYTGWISYFNSCKQECLPINAHSRSSVQKLLDLVEFKLKEVMTREPTLLAMVLGVPNVGKSALINSIHQIALSRFTGEDELEWGLCLVLLKILLDSGLEIFNNIKGQILLLLLVP